MSFLLGRLSLDARVLDGMDGKGRSLPLMAEPPNPVSMKQAPETLGGRKGRADMNGDPALLMDQAAAQLAVTLQDGVLQNMSGHSHTHERLKDLTSRVLNGKQEKLTKLCAAEPTILKVVEAPPQHPSPQGKGASDIQIHITKMVAKSEPLFVSCFGEDGDPPAQAAPPNGVPSLPTKGKPGKRRKGKKVLVPRANPQLASPMVPLETPKEVEAKDGTEMANDSMSGTPGKVCERREVHFFVGDVVWTKVSGYPWWPCMVTTDPVLNHHVKQKATNSRRGLLYHVQYFGDTPERGYIFERSMVTFGGKEQYQELCHSRTKQSATRVNPKKTHHSVPLKLRAQWSMGVSQATEAIGMALEERIASFTFTYTGGQPQLNPHVLRDLPATPCNAAPARQRQQAVSAPHAPSQGKRRAQVLPASSEGSKLLEQKQRNGPRFRESGRPVQKRAQLAAVPAAEGGLPPPTELPASPAKKDGRSRICPTPEKRGTKSHLKGTKGSAETKNPRKRTLSRAGEKAEQPRKRAKLDGRVWKRKGEPSPTVKKKLEVKATSVKKRSPRGAEADICATQEKPKPAKKRRRQLKAQSAATPPRKKCLQHSPEPEESLCEEQPDSPAASTDDLHAAKRGERNAKKEYVCQVCEGVGEELLLCEGQCCGAFHSRCLDAPSRPQAKVLCQTCRSGIQQCFSCKGTDGSIQRCVVQQCGRFYHEACARLNALSVFKNKGFRCPLHVCLSCHFNSRSKATKGKMLRCVRCPVAYHAGDLCMAAGSRVLSANAIICTNHFSAKKGYSHHSHVNVSWCFICSKGGSLLCCESCPAAFHADCLNISMPDGTWYCNDCRAGKKPRYKDIIWVKLGNYRWWPAEIRHPRSVPTNIQKLRHEIGEFPVFFFGSKDYFWTHQARVFPYMEGDRGSKYQGNGIGKVFKNALMDAEARFVEIKREREAKEAQENDKKPPPYKYIKVNKPCGRVQIYTADVSEIPKCNCKPSDEKPCGFESECLNRMLLYECHPQVCPAGARCHNQAFTKRQYPDTKVIKTAGKGWGLLALRDIKKGEFVNEYVGELIDEEECRARIRYAQENDITHFYMLTIDKDRIIDAGPKGNYSRFMNHSCQPNCETQKWTVNGDTRVGLFAICDIPAGTELTFNYNLDCLGNEKTVCRCGAPNCSGFLGDRPKNSNGLTSEVKGKKPKKKVKKRRARSEGKKQSEDECFRCGDGGQLVLCDKKSCTKAYHLSCLDRTKRPFGRWDCPWHHCDVCGKNSEAFCQLCPNSFCKDHQEGALRLWAPTGQWCCQEHDELELRPAADSREAEPPFADGHRLPKSSQKA
ncbi:histone-lysine N-methyltransferase NSD2 isoform X1 [Paramormyrops kingsleyae]|uniref:histone-lysine N-methyltransferase NSD2 isoform X1 n=2 Tax=Paramormyrops kingsleyae TaxID=1676925 RepID=UPI000CD5EF1F|nr:histone-lysine N-methyltransferase NSD2 isoform X1 [Paramormyrops kingsleyae]